MPTIEPMPWRRYTLRFVLLSSCLTACSPEAMKVTMEATETASTVFKGAKDEARIQRDKVASTRLGELSVGSERLTVAELDRLKSIVASPRQMGK